MNPKSLLGRRFSPLYLVFPVALAAVLALARASYRYASELEQKSEQSLVINNDILGKQALDHIDDFIIASDLQLFNLVDLDHLSDFQRRWNQIVNLSPDIDAALVLNERHEILPNGYVWKKSARDADAFRSLFRDSILPDLRLDALEANRHRHLNARYDGHDYLISYIKRVENQRIYYVVLKISLDYVLKVLFPDELGRMSSNLQLCIRDSVGNVVYGAPVVQPGKFLFEGVFPTTLYRWQLEIAPERTSSLASTERARHQSELLFISLGCGVVVISIGFLFYAIDKERRANELKGDFISNVSHELKTPLSLIRMFGELLAMGKLKSPEKAKEYAEIITRESERLTRLIDNVLDFSRIEQGRAAYDFQPGRLDAVVERALDVYRYRAEREGFRLAVKIDPELPETLIDENAMTLLLLNLLENALKYGKEEIAVYLTRVSGDLRLVVEDRGPGIPADEQKKIFERFYRTREARGTNVRGSGIGLSLVKHIAEAHRGRVTVESEPGKGAAFIVDLPLADNGRAKPPGNALGVAA